MSQLFIYEYEIVETTSNRFSFFGTLTIGIVRIKAEMIMHEVLSKQNI